MPVSPAATGRRAALTAAAGCGAALAAAIAIWVVETRKSGLFFAAWLGRPGAAKPGAYFTLLGYGHEAGCPA